jgi:hypothetical protein
MAYTDFTIEKIEKLLDIQSHQGDLFPDSEPVKAPIWLEELLSRGMQLSLISEKARSEFIVAPILLACRELSGNVLAIFSGQRLDVDSDKGLQGECDFILTFSEPVPTVRAPLIAVVEAKKNDIEGGLGQCMAQMAAIRLFNEREGKLLSAVYGCVTTGEAWQFLCLEGMSFIIDRLRRYINRVDEILGIFQSIISKISKN